MTIVKVVEALGLNLFEEFTLGEIVDSEIKYRFTPKGLEVCIRTDKDLSDVWKPCDSRLNSILTGDLSIIKNLE